MRADSIAGLLRVLKDPKSVEAHLDKIAKAEAALTKARTDFASEKKKVNDLKSDQDDREAALAKRETAVAKAEAEVSFKQETLVKERKDYAEFEKKTSASLSQQADNHRQKEAELHQQAQTLDAKAAKLHQLETELKSREAAVAKLEIEHNERAAKLREVFK